MPQGADSVHEKYGAPALVWLHVAVDPSPTLAASSNPTAGGRAASPPSFSVSFNVQLFAKTATRLAEASWLSFAAPSHSPRAQPAGWQLAPFGSHGPEVDTADVVSRPASCPQFPSAPRRSA